MADWLHAAQEVLLLLNPNDRQKLRNSELKVDALYINFIQHMHDRVRRVWLGSCGCGWVPAGFLLLPAGKVNE